MSATPGALILPDPPSMNLPAVALANNLDPNEEALQLWPSSGGPGVALGKAGALLFAGEAEKALASYRSIVDTDLDLEARLGVVHSLLAQGDHAKALEETLNVTGAHSDCIYGWILQARLEAALGYIDEALAATEEALRLSPKWPELWNLKGVLLGAKGSWRQAEEIFGKAAAMREDSPVVWNNLGVAHLRIGDPDGAINALSRALTLEPHYPEALSNLGTALRLKGEHDKSSKAYRGATVLSDAPGFQLNLASSLEIAGEREEALGRIDAILAKHPDYGPALEAKARLEGRP